MHMQVKLLVGCMAICEFLVGGWLLVFAGMQMLEAMLSSASPTLTWLFGPMGVVGLLLLMAAFCSVFGRLKTSGALLLFVCVAAVFRWISNWNFVFPFGQGESAPISTPLALLVWQTQQFGFAMLAVLLLVGTAFSIRRMTSTESLI